MEDADVTGAPAAVISEHIVAVTVVTDTHAFDVALSVLSRDSGEHAVAVSVHAATGQEGLLGDVLGAGVVPITLVGSASETTVQ